MKTAIIWTVIWLIFGIIALLLIFAPTPQNKSAPTQAAPCNCGKICDKHMHCGLESCPHGMNRQAVVVNAACPVTASAGPRIAVEDDLVKLYARVNKNYFNAKLPSDTLILFVQPPDKNDIGQTVCNDDFSRCTIYVSSIYNTSLNQAEATELHEICHIATQDGTHGPKWTGCMVSLANRGAWEGIW